VNVRVIDLDPSTEKIFVSVKQALPAAIAADELKVGSAVSGVVSQIHAEQVVVSLVPSQLTALLSLSNLSNHRHLGVAELRSSLKVGERLDELVVVSKNATSGLLIVANKPSTSATSAAKPTSGISRSAVSMDALEVGQVVPGRVISHTPQGTMIQLGSALRGRVHPTDTADDLSLVAGPDGPLKVDDNTMCYILSVNPATKIIDLSTRKSRTDADSAIPIIDKEVANVADLKIGQSVRGLVKNVGNGLFVSLGRTVTARVMIKELFDDVS
jgi:rRNA biogenesis protein RRP5